MLPSLTDLRVLLTYLVERGDVLTSDEFDDALMQLGRVDGPALLSWLHGCSLVTADDLTRSVGEVWSMAEYPDAMLSHRRWLELFAKAGFTIDGRAAMRPAEPLLLYRGSVPERRANWSWTDSLETALSYANDGIRGRQPGKVWAAMVAPERLLARNTGRDEHEYVINTDQLMIAEYRARTAR
ncbi:hypothetical protein [Amycolatopsis sp. NPDC059657]|uniref:hypothetical protein n=1 Tax=Amycolatopsis sp. NPDC059657 TaxID=3346899 RepID=UPI0036714AE0